MKNIKDSEKRIMDDVSKLFFSRKGVNTSHILPKELSHCVNFLLEELACHTIMYGKIKATTFYPGSQPSCYKYVKENGLPDIPEGLKNMYYSRLIFHGIEKKRNQTLPTEIKAA